MSRIAIPAREAAPAASQPLLDAVHRQLGVVPNLFRLMSLSPVALTAYLGLHAPLARSFDARTREAVALAVSEADGCNYCLAAHCYLAAHVAKSSAEEIELNRAGRSLDAKRGAAAAFARALVERRGHVTDAELAAARSAGFDDEHIVELVVLAIDTVLTNFLNEVARTDIDFPAVRPAGATPVLVAA